MRWEGRIGVPSRPRKGAGSPWRLLDPCRKCGLGDGYIASIWEGMQWEQKFEMISSNLARLPMVPVDPTADDAEQVECFLRDTHSIINAKSCSYTPTR